MCLEAQDSKKDDPFQVVPGFIPGSCIPAFTGTRIHLEENLEGKGFYISGTDEQNTCQGFRCSSDDQRL